MAIFNKQVLLAAVLLLVASSSAASERKQFLRHSNNNNRVEQRNRKLTSKSAKDTKGNGNGAPGAEPEPSSSVPLQIVPIPAPVKLAPDLDDWIAGCSAASSAINNCIGGTTRVSSPFNCKTCLRALSFTSSDANASGVAACAKSPTCGQCTPDKIRPFYACGLGVKSNFGSGTVSADPNLVVITPPVVFPITPPAPTAAPTAEVKYDFINCPFQWPGSGTKCVMLDGFHFKNCFYFELGLDAKCTCSKEQPIWSCTGSLSPPIVVEKEDLMVEIEDLVDTPIIITGQGIDVEIEDIVDNPIIDVEIEDIVDNNPITITGPGIDLEITSGELPVALCPMVIPQTGDACSTGGFATTQCCYQDPSPIVGTLGTIQCMCTNGGFEGFQCNRGTLSVCTV